MQLSLKSISPQDIGQVATKVRIKQTILRIVGGLLVNFRCEIDVFFSLYVVPSQSLPQSCCCERAAAGQNCLEFSCLLCRLVRLQR